MTPEQERELAEEVVHCLGLPLYTVPGGAVLFESKMYYFNSDAPQFIRDWRVAGAMMELVKEAGHRIEVTYDGHVHIVRRGYQFFNKLALLGQAKNESLPIAINQVCVAALRGKDD